MKKVFHTMKVNKENAIEAHNKCCMKHLKEKCDIGDKDKLQQNIAARAPMIKD